MFDKIQAQQNLEKYYPVAVIKEYAEYKDIYLFRVEHPDPNEKDWDPFFSVNKSTGEVRDFSILEDIDTILNLNWIDI